jgi:hypothetical protein
VCSSGLERDRSSLSVISWVSDARPHHTHHWELTLKIKDLQRFVAIVQAGSHVPRAADAIGVPMAALYTTLDRLEDEVGHPLFTRAKSGWTLTPAGELLVGEAKQRIADAPAAVARPKAPAGGKAKASKGKGRAPIVKGEPKPYKKRQGR